jgi:UDP-N-acetyl-D-mannosaminuronate dehydrogenase
LRESPALNLIGQLRAEGANVTWCDPLVKVWNDEMSTELSTDVNLGLIVTPHKKIDFSIWRKSDLQVIDLSASSFNLGWDKFL